MKSKIEFKNSFRRVVEFCFEPEGDNFYLLEGENLTFLFEGKDEEVFHLALDAYTSKVDDTIVVQVFPMSGNIEVSYKNELIRKLVG